MLDITIIGTGNTGQNLARACTAAGLNVLLVDKDGGNSSNHPYENVTGLGVIAHTGMVHILNRDTGDEVRIVESRAVAFALDAAPDVSYSRMSGIAKFGVQFTADGKIQVNADGQTNASRIYATGPWVSEKTPGITDAIVRFCKSNIAKDRLEFGS